MNIKKSLLPVALFAATALGGKAIINSQSDNDNQNKIEFTKQQNNKQVDEKAVFDYMKHTSIPIKNETRNGMNLAMGLFGLGIAGAKRKEIVLNSIDNIESFVEKLPEEKRDIQLIKQCKRLRDYINRENLNKNDIIDIKALVSAMEKDLTDKVNRDTVWAGPVTDIWAINGFLNENFDTDDQEYHDTCMVHMQKILNGAVNISRKGTGVYAIEPKFEAIRLRRLIEEGESDFPELKDEIIEILDKQDKLLENASDMSNDRLAYNMYQNIPRMLWLIEKYTTPKMIWDKGRNTVKFRHPAIEDYRHDHDDYLRFAADTLKTCRNLRSELKLNSTKHVAEMVSNIQGHLVNYGTYNNEAFANAMLICDSILNKCTPDGRYNGSLSELTFNAKCLFENVYTSVNNPAHNRPYGPVPATFEEWNSEMERIEKRQSSATAWYERFGAPHNGEFTPSPIEHVPSASGYRGHTLQEFMEEYKRNHPIEKNMGTKSREVQEEWNNEELQKTENTKITFASVGGQDKAIEQLKKKVLYPVKYPNAFRNRMLSHGIIMHGRPGTGKTLVALALSNEADANFIKINASELTSSLHGETDRKWRELFAEARQKQPCIIFIDEFDTVAQKRGHNATNNYDDTVINTILTEMSDIEKNGDNVFVIGATNRFEVLDSGMIRAGRFGTHIELKAPETVKDILQIFDIHTKDKPLDDDVDKEKLAKMMLEKNVTGSDIASIINEALENTFLRLGIYEKMEDGSFNDDDLSDIKTNMTDFIDAIENYEVVIDKNSSKRAIIGFNKR